MHNVLWPELFFEGIERCFVTSCSLSFLCLPAPFARVTFYSDCRRMVRKEKVLVYFMSECTICLLHNENKPSNAVLSNIRSFRRFSFLFVFTFIHRWSCRSVTRSRRSSRSSAGHFIPVSHGTVVSFRISTLLHRRLDVSKPIDNHCWKAYKRWSIAAQMKHQVYGSIQRKLSDWVIRVLQSSI